MFLGLLQSRRDTPPSTELGRGLSPNVSNLKSIMEDDEDGEKSQQSRQKQLAGQSGASVSSPRGSLRPSLKPTSPPQQSSEEHKKTLQSPAMSGTSSAVSDEVLINQQDLCAIPAEPKSRLVLQSKGAGKMLHIANQGISSSWQGMTTEEQEEVEEDEDIENALKKGDQMQPSNSLPTTHSRRQSAQIDAERKC